MTNSINQGGAQDTAACCCCDVGKILDNSDCTASFCHVYAEENVAQSMLENLTQKARAVESDPCQIQSHIVKIAGGYQLNVDLTFACQAEMLIFQLGLR